MASPPQFFQSADHTNHAQLDVGSSGYPSHSALADVGSHDTLYTQYPVDGQNRAEDLIQPRPNPAEDLKQIPEPGIQHVSSGWSSGQGSIGCADEKGNNILSLNSTEFAKSKSSTSKRCGNWAMEIFSIVIAFGAVASIIGLLARYDGKALPSWPYDITLNALIAVLTTVANTAMAVVLSSGLGQLKWDRVKRGYVPLADMEILDEASRGAWGACKMLWRLRGG